MVLLITSSRRELISVEQINCVYGGGGDRPHQNETGYLLRIVGGPTRLNPHPMRVVLDKSGVGREAPNIGGSMYTNRLGHKGAKSKDSVQVNGASGAGGMAGLKCREQDDAGVVVMISGVVATPAEWVEEWVSLPLLLEIRLKCTVSDRR